MNDTTSAQHATTSDIAAWFTGRLPAAWTESGAPDVAVDREEITVTLVLDAPSAEGDQSTRQRQRPRPAEWPASGRTPASSG
jgi:hypothetical protein